MSEMMSDLQWMRARQFLDEQLARLDQVRSENPEMSEYGRGYFDGQYLMTLRVRYLYFVSPQERIEAEQVRREMFG